MRFAFDCPDGQMRPQSVEELVVLGISVSAQDALKALMECTNAQNKEEVIENRGQEGVLHGL